MPKTYKIPSEDKAAFLNRLEKAGVNINTSKIIDDKLDGTFKVTFDNPEDLEKVKTIFKQSPKINTLKEAIRTIVREQIKKKRLGS